MVKNFQTMVKAIVRKEYGLAAIGAVLFLLEATLLFGAIALLWEMNKLALMLLQYEVGNYRHNDPVTGTILLVVGNGVAIVLALGYFQWRFRTQALWLANAVFSFFDALEKKGDQAWDSLEKLEERYKTLANTESDKKE